MGNIDQLLCTHCTFETSFLHQSKTHLKDHVFEYSARAGSVDRAQSHELFRRIERFLNYRLPTDAPHSALVEHDARSLPKRLVYLPSANGLYLVSQISYRRYDAMKRQAGAYFAHVLLEMPADARQSPAGRPLAPPPNAPVDSKLNVEWSARDAAQMWGWPQWIEEDDTEPNAKPFQNVLDRFLKLPTPEAHPETWDTLDSNQRVGDEALTAFLQADAEHQPSWIPMRWNGVPARIRQQLLAEFLHGFLKLNLNARECFLVGIEPALAALLFFGVARLIPRRGPAEQLSFSTCEPQNIRPPVALAATHSYLGAPFTLAEDPRHCTLALNTFQPGWENTRTARNLGLTETSYAQAIVNLYVGKGASAVDRFLQPFDDDTNFFPPTTADELAELPAAEAYGQWIIGSAHTTAKPIPPTSKSGERYVASIVRAAMSSLQGNRIQNPARWQPLLHILAKMDETLGTGSPAEVQQQKRLVDDILRQIGNHPAESEDCLEPSSGLPNGWQVQLVTQFIQGRKPLPDGLEDFWKGRFANPDRQAWLSMIADRLVAQKGAGGLELLLQRYESWAKAQPELPANGALAQSGASVLQLLCDIAGKNPSAGAQVHVERLVNQFLEKNSRWHDELLNRDYWTPRQTKALLDIYANRSVKLAGQTVAGSLLAASVLRDLNDFPCLPPGTKPPSDGESWLAFLETADAALQLRHRNQVSAWKQLSNLLNDLGLLWAAKPTRVKSQLGTTEWEDRASVLGAKICNTVQSATNLDPVVEGKRWARLKSFQQLINPSFQWRINSKDIVEANFSSEVSTHLDQRVSWNPQWNQTSSRTGSDHGATKLRIAGLVIAAGVVLILSIGGAAIWHSAANAAAEKLARQKEADEKELEEKRALAKKQQLADEQAIADKKALADAHERKKQQALIDEQARKERLALKAKQALAEQAEWEAREQKRLMAEKAEKQAMAERQALEEKPSAKMLEELQPVFKKLWTTLSSDLQQFTIEQFCDKAKLEMQLRETLKDHWKTSPAAILRHIVSPHGTLSIRQTNLKQSRKDWLADNVPQDRLFHVFHLLMNDKDPAFRQAVALTIASPEAVSAFETNEHRVLLTTEWLKDKAPELAADESIQSVKGRAALGEMLLRELSNNVNNFIAPSELPGEILLGNEFKCHATRFYLKALLDHEDSRLTSYGTRRATALKQLRPRFVKSFQSNEPCSIALTSTVLAFNLHGLDEIRDSVAFNAGSLSWDSGDVMKLENHDWWKNHDVRFSLPNRSDNKSLLDIRFSPVGETQFIIEVPKAAERYIHLMQLLVLETMGIDKDGNLHSEWINLYEGKPDSIVIEGGRIPSGSATSSILDIKNNWNVEFSGNGYVHRLQEAPTCLFSFPASPPDPYGWELKKPVSTLLSADDSKRLEAARLVFEHGVPTLIVRSRVDENPKLEIAGLEKLQTMLTEAKKQAKTGNANFDPDWFNRFNAQINESAIKDVSPIQPKVLREGESSDAFQDRASKAFLATQAEVNNRLKKAKDEAKKSEQKSPLVGPIDDLQMSVSFDFSRRVKDADASKEVSSLLVPIWNSSNGK